MATDLSAQKRALLQESERNRRLLAEDVVHLRSTANWVQSGLAVARAASPVVLFLGPLVRLISGRKAKAAAEASSARRKRTGYLGKMMTALQWYRRVKPVLDHLRAVRSA